MRTPRKFKVWEVPREPTGQEMMTMADAYRRLDALIYGSPPGPSFIHNWRGRGGESQYPEGRWSPRSREWVWTGGTLLSRWERITVALIQVEWWHRLSGWEPTPAEMEWWCEAAAAQATVSTFVDVVGGDWDWVNMAAEYARKVQTAGSTRRHEH